MEQIGKDGKEFKILLNTKEFVSSDILQSKVQMRVLGEPEQIVIEAVIPKLRDRYRTQGYYRNNRLERISPDDIHYKVIPTIQIGEELKRDQQ